jgi:hypothetical protein
VHTKRRLYKILVNTNQVYNHLGDDYRYILVPLAGDRDRIHHGDHMDRFLGLDQMKYGKQVV